MPLGTDRISVLYLQCQWPSASTECLRRNGEIVVNLSSNLEVRVSIPVFRQAGWLPTMGLIAAQCNPWKGCFSFPSASRDSRDSLIWNLLSWVLFGRGFYHPFTAKEKLSMDRDHHNALLIRWGSGVLSYSRYVSKLFFIFHFTIWCHRLPW